MHMKMKYLHNSTLSWDFQDLSLSDRTITKTNIDDLSKFREFDIVENDQRTIYFDNGSIVNSRCDVIIASGSLSVQIKSLYGH